MAFVGFYV